MSIFHHNFQSWLVAGGLFKLFNLTCSLSQLMQLFMVVLFKGNLMNYRRFCTHTQIITLPKQKRLECNNFDDWWAEVVIVGMLVQSVTTVNILEHLACWQWTKVEHPPMPRCLLQNLDGNEFNYINHPRKCNNLQNSFLDSSILSASDESTT